METFWFWVVAGMLTLYVVLDGFDFGAGILSLFVAKTDSERRSVFAAIGPYWDGNEVWLIAGGGALFFAFPRAYSAGFSGFYLPLTLVLWLLMMRGLSIEFRSKEENALWRSFWDGCFFLASSLMALVLGVALGNLIRGVPMEADQYFTTPFFTNFLPGVKPGVLDWYTVSVGLFSVVALALHGALFFRLKLEGPVSERAEALVKPLWRTAFGLFVIVSFGTAYVRPDLSGGLFAKPLSLIFAAIALFAFGSIPRFLTSANPGRAFMASCVFLGGLLASAASALFPILLRSTDPSVGQDIDIYSDRPSALAMQFGSAVWFVAILLVLFYFVHLFRTFAGKVRIEDAQVH